MLDIVMRELTAHVPHTEEVVRIMFRLAVAVLLGAVVGVQRERAGKPAGMRTHMLVSLGACMFVLSALEAGMSIGDASRVIQGLITGIGFIGAGAILKLKDEPTVKGLTSAAGIWLTAAVGVAAGLGAWMVALTGVVLGWIILASMRRIEARLTSAAEAAGKP